MKKSSFIYVLIVAVIFSSCVSREKKESTISLSGAFALYPLAVKWAEEYQKEHPEIRFNISGGGAGKGMADALAGTVDLGMFSREIAQEEKNQGVWWVGLTIDAVIPTISSRNQLLAQLKSRGLTREEFAGIFIQESITDWGELLKTGETYPVVLLTRSDACGAAETWARYLGGKQEDLKGIGIYGDPGLAEAVTKETGGIAYNNTNYVYDIKTGKKRPGIEIVPIDINGNGQVDPEENFYDEEEELLAAIAAGVYPSPPARELYFVSEGKPAKQSVLDFIKWTLTEGQKYVKEAGYVPIDREKINKYLEQLN
jgi:phosphate transport system substrate-binding protein